MASPIQVELLANISEFKARMAEARNEMKETAEKGGSHMSGLASVGKAALLGVGGAAISVAGFALEMADKFEQSHARLEQAIKNTGGTFDKYSGQINATQKRLEGYGFTNAQVQDALAHSVVSTQDVGKSLSEMGLAADLAKFKNIDLTSATDMLDKAMTGNLRPLKALGIDIPVAATNALKLETANAALATAQQKVTDILAAHSDAMQVGSKYHAQYEAAVAKVTAAQEKLTAAHGASKEILDALTERLGGQAQAQADTFGGKMLTLKTQAEDFAKNVGMKLIPILEKLMTVVKDVVDWLSKHKEVAAALAIVVGGVLLLALVAYTASMISAAAATLIAMAPILLIVAAAALLAAGIYFLWTNWDQIWSWIMNHKAYAAIIAALLPFVTIPVLIIGAIKELSQHWDQVWTDMTHWVEDAWNAIPAVVGAGVKFIVDAFINMALRVVSAAADAFGWVPGLGPKLKQAKRDVEQFRDDTNNAIDGIVKSVQIHISGDFSGFANAAQQAAADADRLIGGAQHMMNQRAQAAASALGDSTGATDTGATGFNPNAHAAGTRYAPGGWSWVGERGPELLNLDRGAQVIPNDRSVGAGGGTTVVVNVAGSVTTDRDLVDMIRAALLRDGRSNINVGLT